MNASHLLDIAARTDFFVLHKRGGITFPPVICPALSRVFSTGIEKVIPGMNYDPLLYIYHRGKTTVLLPRIKFEKTGDAALSMLKKDPMMVAAYRKKFLAKCDGFIRYMQSMDKGLRKAADEDLLKYYGDYILLYFDACMLGEPIALALDEPLSACLRGLLSDRIGDKKQAEKMATLLMTPTQSSFLAQEEEDIRKIAKQVRSSGMSFIFRKNEDEICKTLAKFPSVKKRITAHTKRYYWVPYDYLGEVWTEKDFITRIKEILKQERKSPQMSDLKRQQKAAFASLLQKGILSQGDKKLFLAAQDAAILLDVKKEKLTQVHFYANRLVREVARRRDVDFNKIIFLLEEEFKALIQWKFDAGSLEDRSKGSTYFCMNYQIYRLGKKETDFILKHCIRSMMSKEICGLAASPGVVLGRVRVVPSPKDCASLVKGEILVAGMTTPSYALAIRKASGIITDEGGITCHASIVSREMGIPCIVGTKNATKVLKTGDLVELDGEAGSVRRITSKEDRPQKQRHLRHQPKKFS